jgi:ankyrin repeat protein
MKTGWIAILLACVALPGMANAESANLFIAARTNDLNGARALLANKADINQQDEKGYTPLIIATYKGNYDVAQFFLDHGAATEKKDASGRTALMGVSFKGDDRDVELLLQHGADVNAKDSKGLTSMMYAVMFGRLSVVKILRANEASKSTTPSATSN